MNKLIIAWAAFQAPVALYFLGVPLSWSAKHILCGAIVMELIAIVAAWFSIS